jgi:hypothetical protein
MKKILALLLLLFNFAHSQTALIQEESQSIIGTWVIEGETNNKWVFTASNTCRWEFNGVTINNFIYTVSSQLSPNGVEHVYIKLVNNIEIHEYEINGLNNEKLTLESFDPKLGYIYFYKQ